MYDEKLAETVRAVMSTLHPFTERKMFGGLAFLFGGNMACGVTRSELMVRTGPYRFDEALAHTGARPMDLTGRPSRGMVIVEDCSARADELEWWIRLGTEVAAGLPPKVQGADRPATRPQRRRAD